jgi:hypothetical protein
VSEELTLRFSELVRRELGANSVVLAGADEPVGEGALFSVLADGRRVEARFDHPVTEAESVTRRLEILVRAFESVLFDAEPAPKKRAPIAVSLHDELKALAMRCSAVDAVVIDAHSPVVWASAEGGTTVDPTTRDSLPDEARRMLHIVRESHRGALHALRPPRSEPPSDEGEPLHKPDLDSPWDPVGPTPRAANEVTAISARAIARVRELPQMPTLHRGGHLAHSEPPSDGELGYVARSFAGIYALVVVFEELPDELRVERAIRDGLPRIERLVLALPPLDPDPLPAGVVAIRGRRRR